MWQGRLRLQTFATLLARALQLSVDKLTGMFNKTLGLGVTGSMTMSQISVATRCMSDNV